MSFSEYRKSQKRAVENLKNKYRAEWYKFVKDHLLTEDGKKQLDLEYKTTDEKKGWRLITEIYILYKFAKLGFEIDKPGPKKGDILAQDNSRKYIIEVYQPEVAKDKCLKEFFNKMEKEKKTSGTLAYETIDLLKETVSGGIEYKKKKHQLTKDESSINILCVDFSDRSILEQPGIILDELQEENWEKSELIKLFDKWDALNGFILSSWDESWTEKEGILIHKDIDKESINILNKIINLHEL